MTDPDNNYPGYDPSPEEDPSAGDPAPSSQTGWVYYQPGTSGTTDTGSSRPVEEGPQESSSGSSDDCSSQDTFSPSLSSRDSYHWSYDDYSDSQGRDPSPSDPPEGTKGRNRRIVLTTLACIFLVILIAFAGIGVRSLITRNNDKDTAELPAGPVSSEADTDEFELQVAENPSVSPSASENGELSYVDIHKMVRPSIVCIVQYKLQYQQYVESGSASGIILSEDGYILTNAHVISGADAVKVIIENGEEYEAVVIGSDSRNDLAVVKITAEGLTPAVFGDSDALEVGEKVCAIGNPDGLYLAGSITEGIISGLNRTVLTSEGGYSINCIQTSTPINPGNSGGALVNMSGQVVGINSSKISATSYEGIGFAIPVTEAKPIIDSLINYGRVVNRAMFGITATPIGEVSSKLNNVPVGLQIVSILEKSSFTGTQVQVGDIITAIDGTEISSFDDVAAILDRHLPGDRVSVTLYRRSSREENYFTVKVALVEDSGSSK